ELVIRDDIFDVLGPDHHTLAKIESPRATEQFAFAPDAREARVTLGDDGEVGRGSVSFFLLGVHHILSGYDHLLFLLGLILRGGRMLSLFKIITAFTVAHSVTLALAVLDVVVLPDRLVEAVIALSIALVAADNLSPRPAVPRRWVVSFLFGLVHGFGFSAVLRKLDGGGLSKTTRRPLGWTKPRRAACRQTRRRGSRRLPYVRSPTIGCPSAASWARIWPRRPVTSASSSSVAPR